MDSNFNEAIKKVFDLMTTANTPFCLSVELVMEDGKNRYRFIDETTAGKDTRKKIKKILSDMWQGGAYNYDQIARYLRISDLDVSMILDDELARKRGLVI
jgi:hypothetical protein